MQDCLSLKETVAARHLGRAKLDEEGTNQVAGGVSGAQLRRLPWSRLNIVQNHAFWSLSDVILEPSSCWAGVAFKMLVGRRRNQLEFLLLRPQMKLDEQAGMQQKLAKKCQVGWPGREIPAAVQVEHCILAKLHPALGDLIAFGEAKNAFRSRRVKIARNLKPTQLPNGNQGT